MTLPKAPLIAALLRFASGLRFRNLFLLTLGLFVLDVLIPDLIPFTDELILGLLTLLLANWKAKKTAPDSQDSFRKDYIDAEFKREDDNK